MQRKILGLLVGSVLTFSAAVFAEDAKPSFDEYVQGLKQEATEKGYSKTLIDSAFHELTYRERAVKADKNQPEKKLLLNEYVAKAVPKWKVEKARKLYQENKDVLERVGEKYGVQPRFIVALWGIESNFGSYMGNFNVVEALTTMAYEGRRETFFRKEIFSALDILTEGHINVANMKGSWAGAMGQCQFMPSSFISFAQDGNNDGKKDIWQTEADVFASAANYLKRNGWNDEYTWGREVYAPANIDNNLIGLEKSKGKTLAEWQQLGVLKANKTALPNVDINAWLVQPDDGLNRSFLVYGNYQSLMRWNRSHYFGVAVSTLADHIKDA